MTDFKKALAISKKISTDYTDCMECVDGYVFSDSAGARAPIVVLKESGEVLTYAQFVGRGTYNSSIVQKKKIK